MIHVDRFLWSIIILLLLAGCAGINSTHSVETPTMPFTETAAATKTHTPTETPHRHFVKIGFKRDT